MTWEENKGLKFSKVKSFDIFKKIDSKHLYFSFLPAPSSPEKMKGYLKKNSTGSKSISVDHMVKTYFLENTNHLASH